MRHQSLIASGIFSTVALVFAACSGAVAPMNDAQTAGIAKNEKLSGTGDATTTPSTSPAVSPGTPAGPAGPSPSSDPSTPQSPSPTDEQTTDEPAVNPDGEILGKITGETGADFGLAAKATCAMFNESTVNGMTIRSLTFVVTSAEARESMFRKVKSWSCEKCQGNDDEHCKKDGTTVAQLSISFSPPYSPDPDHKVADTGYPKQDANEVLQGGYTNMANLKSGMAISWSKNAQATDNYGKLTFDAGARPGKVGDPYKASVDVTSGGKNYKATIEGKVYQLPANPTPPTCANDEYLQAEYE